ncbi:hypothetical protein KIW84_074118 [Lathyrus oleraceus]|nr:hypothetical protein KIW84_074118 [Pisum sativum]
MAPTSLPLNLNFKVTAAATTNLPELPEKIRNSRVLVLGGTGRIGGSTATALSNLCPDLQIIVAGRNREKGEALVAKLGGNSGFARVDIDDANSLEIALKGVDLVVHAAGPFQQTEKCSVLEAAINTKTAYIDVCDDTTYSLRAKSFASKALAANVPAITTTGIYPGVSNVMAAELVRLAESESESEDKPERLRFYYYTAGTGGAGPTILATSFLLLGEEVVAYNKGCRLESLCMLILARLNYHFVCRIKQWCWNVQLGEKIKLKPYSGMLKIDFGKGIGKKDVYLLN